MKESVSHIWEGVLDGNPDAWEDLVGRYAALVYSVACHTGLSGSDAEDCSQQTWLALYKGRHSVREPGKLPSWLVSTTRRKASRIMLRNAKAVAAAERVKPRPDQIPVDEAIMQLQRDAQLEFAMEQLDSRCRQILRAIFLAPDNLTYREVARRLGIAPNSLGPTRSRCLNKLRKILTEIGF